QSVFPGVVMIESASEPFALVDGKVEFDLVARVCRRIGSGRVLDYGAVLAEFLKLEAPLRLDTGDDTEKLRKLGERDRPLAVEGARRTPFAQELCGRRDGLGTLARISAQVDLLAGPAGPYRRKRSYKTRIRKSSARRIGVPAFRAARVEQKIVEVPKNEMVV